jgi:IS5 family transposase
MYQAKRCNEWHFSVKTPVGMAANVADITESERLLHGDETDAYADAGYTGAARCPDFQGWNVVWHGGAEKRGKL